MTPNDVVGTGNMSQSQPEAQALGEGGAVSTETQPQDSWVYTSEDPFVDTTELVSQGADEESQPSEAYEEEEGGQEESPNLPKEILEALPEKFRNADDPIGALIKSYTEAEKTLSRLQNQLHQYEEALRQLIMQGQQPKQEQEQEFDIPDDEIITGRELKEYIAKVLQKQIAPVLTQAQLERARAQLKAQHPDYEEIIQSPDFIEFAKTLPPSLLQIADSDPAIASWVIGTYKAQKTKQAQETHRMQEATVRRERLNQLSQPQTKKPAGERVFRASELRRLMIENPEEYARLQPQIILAIREGRYIAD